MATLPPEILLYIFEFLGFPWFAEDIDRLLISKQWYLLARRAFFRDIVLQQSGLHGFLDKIKTGCRDRLKRIHDEEGINNKTSRKSKITPWIREFPTLLGDLHRYTRTLEVHVNGWSEDISPPLAFKWQDRIPENALPNEFLRKRRRLNKELVLLLKILRRMLPRLTTLRLDVEGEHHGSLVGRPYMLPQTLMSLRHLNHLQELELDITGRWTIQTFGHDFDAGEGRVSSHLCEAIAPLLLTLKRLKLRVPTLCPLLLDPFRDPASLTENADTSYCMDSTPIQLEDLIINVANGLWWDDGHHCNGSISYHCNPRLNFLVPAAELYEDIITATKSLMNRSRNPKRVWLIGVILNPFGDLFYHDVLKDRNVLLENEDEERRPSKAKLRMKNCMKCVGEASDAVEASSYLPPLEPKSWINDEDERWELVEHVQEDSNEDNIDQEPRNNAGTVDGHAGEAVPGRGGFTGYVRGNDLVCLNCENDEQRGNGENLPEGLEDANDEASEMEPDDEKLQNRGPNGQAVAQYHGPQFI
jgi:hypothetical protein